MSKKEAVTKIIHAAENMQPILAHGAVVIPEKKWQEFLVAIAEVYKNINENDK